MLYRACFTVFAFLFCFPNSWAQIANGSFETGTLTGWVMTGNGSSQVLEIGDLENILAPQGDYFALLSNGAGDIGNDDIPDQDTLTSLPFMVANNSTLSITWDFLTSEFTGIDSDPSRLDRFEIVLTPQSSQSVILLSGNVGMNGTYSLIDGGNAVYAPDGTALFERLGFTTSYFSLTPGIYSLSFSVVDDGDGSFDSALALDNISISANSVSAPEAQSFPLMIVGLFILTVFYFKPHNRYFVMPNTDK